MKIDPWISGAGTRKHETYWTQYEVRHLGILIFPDTKAVSQRHLADDGGGCYQVPGYYPSDTGKVIKEDRAKGGEDDRNTPSVESDLPDTRPRSPLLENHTKSGVNAKQ